MDLCVYCSPHALSSVKAGTMPYLCVETQCSAQCLLDEWVNNQALQNWETRWYPSQFSTPFSWVSQSTLQRPGRVTPFLLLEWTLLGSDRGPGKDLHLCGVIHGHKTPTHKWTVLGVKIVHLVKAFNFLLHFNLSTACEYVYQWTDLSGCVCGGENKFQGSTMSVPRIELKLPGLEASVSTCWAFSIVHILKEFKHLDWLYQIG